jgi:hypothetical protein
VFLTIPMPGRPSILALTSPYPRPPYPRRLIFVPADLRPRPSYLESGGSTTPTASRRCPPDGSWSQARIRFRTLGRRVGSRPPPPVAGTRTGTGYRCCTPPPGTGGPVVSGRRGGLAAHSVRTGPPGSLLVTAMTQAARRRHQYAYGRGALSLGVRGFFRPARPIQAAPMLPTAVITAAMMTSTCFPPVLGVRGAARFQWSLLPRKPSKTVFGICAGQAGSDGFPGRVQRGFRTGGKARFRIGTRLVSG